MFTIFQVVGSVVSREKKKKRTPKNTSWDLDIPRVGRARQEPQCGSKIELPFRAIDDPSLMIPTLCNKYVLQNAETTSCSQHVSILDAWRLEARE